MTLKKKASKHFHNFQFAEKQSYYFILGLCTVQENVDCESKQPTDDSRVQLSQ